MTGMAAEMMHDLMPFIEECIAVVQRIDMEMESNVRIASQSPLASHDESAGRTPPRAKCDK